MALSVGPTGLDASETVSSRLAPLSCASSTEPDAPPAVSGEAAWACPFGSAGSRLSVNSRSLEIATGVTSLRAMMTRAPSFRNAPHLTGERLRQTDAAVRCRPARDHALMHG